MGRAGICEKDRVRDVEKIMNDTEAEEVKVEGLNVPLVSNNLLEEISFVWKDKCFNFNYTDHFYFSFYASVWISMEL